MTGALTITLKYTSEDGQRELEVKQIVLNEEMRAHEFPRYHVSNETRRLFDKLAAQEGYGE